jgi:AcrR family transcriptional regulator
MPTRERPLRTDAMRNAARIIASAQPVFASAGPQAAMEDIAAEAGVGVATVYRHFPTKVRHSQMWMVIGAKRPSLRPRVY